MANKQTPAREQSPGSSEEDKSGGTFKTDVSETDDEGTTVREAEVRADDLTEVHGSEEQGGGRKEQDQSEKEQRDGSKGHN
jgi:hypothetical protein